jgi:hypothetical protein
MFCSTLIYAIKHRNDKTGVYCMKILKNLFPIARCFLSNPALCPPASRSALNFSSLSQAGHFRSIMTKSHPFHYSGASGVCVTQFIPEPTDTPEIIQKNIKAALEQPNRLTIMLETSGIKEKDIKTQSFKRLTAKEVRSLPYFTQRQKDSLFLPSPGHVCMILTGEDSKPLENTLVSLHPDTNRKEILRGKSVIHTHLYDSFGVSISYAKHGTIKDEFERLSCYICNTGEIFSMISIPLENLKITRKKLLEQIQSARTIKLYNLCASAIQKKDLTSIPLEPQAYIKELIERAKVLPEFRSNPDYLHLLSNPTAEEVLIAGAACTHALARACCGDDTEQFFENLGNTSITTQTAAVFCVMHLLDDKHFLEFAYSIGLLSSLDERYTPALNSDSLVM